MWMKWMIMKMNMGIGKSKKAQVRLKNRFESLIFAFHAFQYKQLHYYINQSMSFSINIFSVSFLCL